MPLSVADAGIRLTGSKTKLGTDNDGVLEVTVTELSTAAVANIMCFINKADYALGATGQGTVNENEACKPGEGNAPGPVTYDGNLTPFKYKNADGTENEDESKTWKFLADKDATVYLYERDEGKAKDGRKPWAVGDEGIMYEVILGVMKPPSNRFEGYVKRSVQTFIQDAIPFKVIAGS